MKGITHLHGPECLGLSIVAEEEIAVGHGRHDVFHEEPHDVRGREVHQKSLVAVHRRARDVQL